MESRLLVWIGVDDFHPESGITVIHICRVSYPHRYSHMKLVVQRVSRARVTVDGDVAGEIGPGLLLFIGVGHDDDRDVVEWMVDKVLSLRIFEDEEGKMNRSVRDERGGVLAISQFTLYGDVSKGTRPSFIKAAKPGPAEDLYNYFVRTLKTQSDLEVASGVFGAKMDIELVNDGPVTILIEK